MTGQKCLFIDKTCQVDKSHLLSNGQDNLPLFAILKMRQIRYISNDDSGLKILSRRPVLFK